MSGDPSDFESFVDNDYSAANIAARFGNFDTAKLTEVAKQLEKYYKTHLSDLNARSTGTVVFTRRATLRTQNWV